MVESTSEPRPLSPHPPAQPQSPQTFSETQAAVEAAEVSVRELLEAGVHFGHQTGRWDPRMRSFIFGERNGTHIIDLDQSVRRFRAALDFLRDVTSRGGKVLLVGTKRQAAPSIQLEASRAGQFYVNNRWLGGMLTNFRTVKRSVDRFKSLLAILEDEEKAQTLTKRERSRLVRECGKYRKSLDGIREMGRLPDAMFVIDVARERIAISEAVRLGIPIVAVVDTNCSPEGIDFVVPGNDDAIRAIQLYCKRVADACVEGADLHNRRLQEESARRAEERKPEAEAAIPGTGRVGVDIKQPPRRGRGRRDEERREEGPGAPRAAARAKVEPAPRPEAPTAPAASPALEAAPKEKEGDAQASD
jgi:small subunit ribosomal protein S2